MKHKAFRAFTVSLKVPSGATIRECQNYILEAVQIWRGQTRPPGLLEDSDPGDPMWDLDPDSVKVTRIKP